MQRSGSIRILYIEDDQGLARLFQKRLQRAGYEVGLAYDGEEGLARYDADSYDVVFVDQSMPGYDGLEVIRRMASCGPLPPTIMVTGTGDERLAVEAMKLGASDYIVKDAEGGYLELLPSVIEKVLQQRRAVEEKQRVERALQESKEKLEGLHEVARHLEACIEEEEVYHLSVDAAERILSFSFCTLGVVEGGQIVTRAASSRLDGARDGLIDEGLGGKTYRAGRTYVVGAMEDASGAEQGRPAYRSCVSAPIGDIGVFQAAATEPDAFSEDDVRLLELLLGHTLGALKRIRLQRDLKEQAIHDPLTGLYNRYYLDQVLDHEVKRSKRYNHCIAFLMIDVNGFKGINDRFGHQVGDRVLQAVASLLRGVVREADIVVRYGGDEFLVILLETDGEAEIVKHRIAEHVVLSNEELKVLDSPVTVSIGSAYWNPADALSVDEVLNEADRQMYEDKRRHNGNHPTR